MTTRKHEFVWDGRDERGEDARLSIIAGRAATDFDLIELDLRLLLYLGRFNHKKGWCRLNQTQLAHLFGVGRQQMNARIKRLVKRKYLEKKGQKKTRESFCFYRVVLDETNPSNGAEGECHLPDDTLPKTLPLPGVSLPRRHSPRGVICRTTRGVSPPRRHGECRLPADTSVAS